LLKKNEIVCISGAGLTLGDWNTEAAVSLVREGAWWTVKLNIPREELPLQYKYGIYNTKEKTFVRYESGENRSLFGEETKGRLSILHDGFVRLPNTTWRGAGVAIPVFSLRSKNSFGVGEFRDLRLMADWCKKTGMKIIQILPVNDTMATNTWVDSYPYAAISAFALHPIYICLEEVAGKKQAALLKPLKKKQKELNDLPELDYEEVMKVKLLVLKQLYTAQKETFLQDEGFIEFFSSNKHWIVPYAAFCCLRDRYGTSDFSQWKTNSRYDKATIEKFVSPRAKHYDEIAFQYYIQYHLHLQLKDAATHAHKNGVILKGDIPIGIYRHSCDAWMNPALYNMNVQAGAPPDDFAVKGQNWGFPTYNWKKMEDDGFAWWKQRFDEMSNYFDAFRIDHILGFFRIWSVPIDAVEGIMGRFVPALPVQVNEFHERNIWFDQHRYTTPFINDSVLWEVFGELHQFVKEEFLAEGGYGQFALKEAFNSQRKVEDYFAGLEQNEHNLRLKHGLFDLISNVILFEEEGSGGTRFHFRISVESTSSFRHLDQPLQQQLRNLYVDYFYYRQDDHWRKEAMHKLPALKASTNMLICGEDLGMVPHCVPDVMKQLGILSLEIQRMPKDPRREFFHPDDAPYLSVVTPSTHDMSTVRGWWEEDRVRTQRFYNNELGQWGDAPFFCEPWISRAIVNQHLHSRAMWSIFLWQDIMGMSETLRGPNPHEERINVPAIPKYYWRYRMHLGLDQLLREKEFNHELKEHIEASGR
ncbi:MAG: 4-alpha-glucanotransferase, partial [Bacteroidetes bacterium]|nr:4-alpha-glucanotransferase [Bacteroidota bacterium]